MATDLETRRELRIGGMDCADCARTIERAVGRIDGISEAEVSFGAARVLYRESTDGPAEGAVERRIRGLGYEVAAPGGELEASQTPRWRTREATALAAALLLLLALPFDLLGAPRWIAVPLFLASILVGGFPIARMGLVGLWATRRPDINLLMAIAALGASAIGAWIEAAMVVVLFSVGELLEGRAVERARRELSALVSLAPATARVQRPGSGAIELPVAELAIGDRIVVRPGERLPVDGRIREGASAIDQAAITGEATPVDRGVGETVFAGTMNGQGMLVVELEADPADSTLERIGRLVIEAQGARSPSERWVDRFATVYTPIVMAAALAVAVVFPLLGADWGDSFYDALALLILACPCALVISTPVSIVSSLARASAAGVLVKGGAHLEQAAAVQTVAFDKTGTLTTGRPTLVSAEAVGVGEDELLRVAASLEQGSEHPLARAVLDEARKRGLPLEDVADFEALTGLGARARIGETTVRVGNPRLFDGRHDVALAAALARVDAVGGTAVVVERDGAALGVLGLADEPRPEAVEALAALARLGITRTVLLTGDTEAAGQAIGARLGLAEVRAGLLPQEKSAAIAGLGRGVAMVGDGINDAPALATADLGLAMGSAGSDAAVEVADVALMGDDPRKVAGLIGTARWTRAVVRQNILFSMATKLAAVVLLAFGLLPLWAAVVSDVGAALIVVTNALRLLRGSPHGRLAGLPLLAAAKPRRAPVAAPSGHAEDDPLCAPTRPACEDGCCAPAGSVASAVAFTLEIVPSCPADQSR